MRIQRTLFNTTAMLLALLAGAPQLALSGTAATIVNVTAGVVASCDIAGDANSGMPAAVLDFGSRQVNQTGTSTAQTPVSGAGALQIVCNNTVTPTLAFGVGSNAGGSTLRRMASAAHVLVDYALFRDSAMSQSIDGTAISLPTMTTSVPYVMVVYGNLPVPSQAVEGAYSDTLSLTLSF